MKLKCRINGKDYDIVQGCSFIDNFNETLDSGTICLDQVYQIKNLQPYDDVFIWNADEEFVGYRNVGDIINLRYDIQRTESGGDAWNSSNPGSFGINITEKNDSYELSGMICDIWSYRFYDFTSENESNCRFGTPQMSLRLHVFVESPGGRTSTYLDDCMIKSSSSHGKISDEIFFGNNNITFNCKYFENSRTFSINKNNKIGENNYIIKEITVVSSSYTAKNINKVFETTIYKEDFSSSSILDFGIRFSYIGSKREYYLKNIIDSIDDDSSRKRVRLDGVNGGELDFVIYKNDDKWQFTLQNNAPTGGVIDTLGFYPYYMLPFIDDMSIMILTSENKEESIKPTFYKHMLVDNFSEEMVGLETGLYKYTIDLFSETKKLEKIILPNISITQSLLESEKRTCWFYLEKYVDTFSPKYKKVFNAINKEWQYVNKYAVSETGTDSNGIIANLKPLFDKTICPEMTLTNPSLRDVLSRIMIVKDIIPIVKDDVIYGLDIGNTTGTFNRDGVNFTVSSMSSSNFATDARREYSGALSQENSAHLVEYLGFRSPNSPFLTLDDMVLETRFPIYKINNIKMCYYKKVELVAGSGSGLSNKEKIIFVKQDITPLVLQNSVRNNLTSNWQIWINNPNDDSFPTHDFSNINYTPPAFDGATDPSGKMQYASQFKLCTVGYDIGSNKITGWGTKYEYLDFLWFKNSCTYIENMVNLVDNINPFGDLTRYEIKEGNSGYSDINATNGINSIVDFNGNTGSWSNIATKIKSIVFEIDYIAMYDGSIIHGKENIDKDDIITPDNCSSSLTVLESDGLFEREKMNRLGNKTIKFTARYDEDNDGSNPNRVQNVGTYDFETDSIIYIREYSIFDKMILANYEATHEYILKNYFTSVWAKYRTYSLMSYSESVKRAENVKKTLVLSKNSAFYENRYSDDDLLFDNLETTELFLSFLTPTQIENNEIKHENKLNCGYFLFYHQNGLVEQTRYFLSDINSFASGTSICFNIKTYDNVSAGSYIDSMQETLTIKDINDFEDQLDYKTTQKWWSMVNSDSDAFEEKIGFYVCNLNQHNFFKDGIYDDSTDIVTDNADRYMKLPGIVDSDVQSFNDNIKNKIGVKKKIICKDNKESLDITMQFSYFTSEKNDIFFSPWVCKLNDLIGYYDKFETTIKRITDADPSCPMTIYGYDGEFASTAYVDNSFKTLVLKIDQNKFNMLSNGTTYDVSNVICNLILNGIDYYISQGVPLNGVTVNGTATLEIKTITKISNISTYSGFCDLECNLRGNYSGETFNYISILGIPIKTNRRSFSGQDSKNSTIRLSLVPVDSVDGNYAYLKGEFLPEFLRNNDILYYNKPFYWFSGKYGTDNIADLNSDNSLILEGQVDVSSFPTEVLRKNMFIVVSREKIKNNLEFNYYRYDDNNSNFGSNMVIDNHNVGQIFSIFKSDDSFIGITVHAEEYSNYSQQYNFDIKSIQYYYRDNNTNIMYFVFGVNLLDDLDGNTSFEPFNIYLSAMSKRSMNVYDEDHNIIGKVANAIDINNFEEQKYELNQNIPSEYQEVEYLESDGRQYIRVLNELSDIPGANFEIDFMVFDNKDTTEHYILGVENELGPGKSGMSMKVGFNETQNKAIATILHTDNAVMEIESEDVILLPNQKYNARFYSNTLYVNGILKAEIGYYETTYYSPQGIGLFACVNTTSDDDYNILAKKFNGRIYNFKIYSTSSLVANLVPCIRLVDNKPGMFDKISKRFYTNEGLGEFKFKI